MWAVRVSAPASAVLAAVIIIIMIIAIVYDRLQLAYIYGVSDIFSADPALPCASLRRSCLPFLLCDSTRIHGSIHVHCIIIMHCDGSCAQPETRIPPSRLLTAWVPACVVILL